MPRQKELELTEEEAEANIKKHEKEHGKIMELDDDAKRKGFGSHDVPTQAQIDGDPEFFRKGGRHKVKDE